MRTENRHLWAFYALVIALFAIFMFVKVVDAHTPTVYLDCEGGLTVDLQKYDLHGRNQVRITIDGTLIIDQDFLESYFVTYQEFDPLTSHTAFVQVYAWDDPNGAKGFSKEFTLEIGPCQDPTSSTSPTPTPSPATTPTPQPSSTPSPTPVGTPRPTGPPTDTE